MVERPGSTGLPAATYCCAWALGSRSGPFAVVPVPRSFLLVVVRSPVLSFFRALLFDCLRSLEETGRFLVCLSLLLRLLLLVLLGTVAAPSCTPPARIHLITSSLTLSFELVAGFLCGW